MVKNAKRMKFGWYGDGGHGERLIGQILAGRKTATASLAYETEDSGVAVGDKLELTDKRGRGHGAIIVTRIEIRLFGALDETLARECGHESLKALREAARFANGREPGADEEMRVTYFRLAAAHKAKP